ncbi:hypothetical protein D918_05153 [Trichuris suis]|nr:hypothetical protein D918_05153 [Trichuris suis]
MAWRDPRVFTVVSCVSRQLKNFSGQIFYDRSKVHWSSGSNAVSIVPPSKQTVNTSNRKLQTRPATPTPGLCLDFCTASHNLLSTLESRERNDLWKNVRLLNSVAWA